jgi:hypothetical protein
MDVPRDFADVKQKMQLAQGFHICDFQIPGYTADVIFLLTHFFYSSIVSEMRRTDRWAYEHGLIITYTIRTFRASKSFVHVDKSPQVGF